MTPYAESERALWTLSTSACIGVMRLLVLGGTHHVGRAVVEAALARGDEVSTVMGSTEH